MIDHRVGPDGTQYAFSRGVTFNEPHMECIDCPYDSHGQDAEWEMICHCRAKGHGIMRKTGMNISKYIDQEADNSPIGVNITLCYLCWNTKQVSVEGGIALNREASRISRLNCEAKTVILDNGSNDGTASAIHNHLGRDVVLLTEVVNKGISKARNRLIDTALSFGSKYILLMDGDIEIVPLSAYVMARYLECHPDVGCIGAYAASFSDNRAHITPALYEIPESRVRSDIRCAFTQYGLFRADMFRDGIRFDESGPFGMTGWGYEDDDLYYQMAERGYRNLYFGGMCYLHRNLKSSWLSIQRSGVDVGKSIAARKSYLLDKWRTRGLDAAILKSIEAQQITV